MGRMGNPGERRYSIRVYPNPNFPIYPAMAAPHLGSGFILPYHNTDLMAENPADWVTAGRRIHCTETQSKSAIEDTPPSRRPGVPDSV